MTMPLAFEEVNCMLTINSPPPFVFPKKKAKIKRSIHFSLHLSLTERITQDRYYQITREDNADAFMDNTCS